MLQNDSSIQKSDLQKPSISSNRSNQPLQPSQPISCPVPPHLQSQQLPQLCHNSTKKLLESKQLQLSPEFKASIDLQVLDTNFQSMRVRVHYGWYVTVVSVLYTEIDQRVFEGDGDGHRRGAFGVVRFVGVAGEEFAVKGIGFEYQDGDIDARNAYRQYLLTLIAGILEIGPKIYPVFGYDIVLTKKMVFFGMEKCQQMTHCESGIIDSELTTNLQTMHSLNFVHIDIKPQNIAYSPSLKKCIFIDFGLSKLLKQSPGQKSKTKFAGTLSYCSEQMKKCYIFQAPQFVNLYQNDLVSLEKSIRVFMRLLSIEKFQEYGKYLNQGELFMEINVFQECVKIIRLKYWIQQNNVNEIIKALKKIDSIRLTVHQIFSNPNLPKSISQHPQIQKTLQKNRTQIFTKSSQIPKIDSTLCDYFSQSKRAACAQKIIPVSQIIHSTEIFNRYLDQPELLLKLYHFFQPFWKDGGDCGEIGDIGDGGKGLCEVKRVIVDIMYEKKIRNVDGPVFFSEKVRSVLIYFYDNLKKLNNLKVFISLRLLFVSIQQWPYANALQSDILQSCPTPFLKLLKLTQFTLFHDLQPDTPEFPQKLRYKKIAQKIPINSTISPQSKIRQVFDFVIQPKAIYAGTMGKERERVRAIIQEVGEDCVAGEEKDGMGLVGVLFGEVCGFRGGFVQVSRGLELYIYSTHSPSPTQPLTPSQKLHIKFFQSPQIELQKLPQNPTTNQMIQNFIQNLLTRKQFIGNVIRRTLSFHLTPGVIGKKEVGRFVEGVKRNVVDRGSGEKEGEGEQEGMEKYEGGKDEDGRKGDWEVQRRGRANLVWIDCMVYSIEYCLEVLLQNMDMQTVQDQKISKQDQKVFMSELSSIISNLLQSPLTQKSISTSKQLQASILILQTKLTIYHNNSPHKLQQSLKQILPLLQPLPHPRFSLIVRFLQLTIPSTSPSTSTSISTSISTSLSQHSTSTEHLLYIMQKYLQNGNYELLQLEQQVEIFIRVRNQMGREMDNLQMVLTLAQEFRKGSLGVGKISRIVYVRVVEVFCSTLQIGKLVGIYWQVKQMGMQFSCQFIAYLIFMIFLQIKPNLPHQTHLHQLTKTTLTLPKMPQILTISLKPKVLIQCRHLISFKSHRKSYILKKLQIRNPANSKQVKGFVRDFGSRVEKFGSIWRNWRNWGEVGVGSRILEKIGRLA